MCFPLKNNLLGDISIIKEGAAKQQSRCFLFISHQSLFHGGFPVNQKLLLTFDTRSFGFLKRSYYYKVPSLSYLLEAINSFSPLPSTS